MNHKKIFLAIIVSTCIFGIQSTSLEARHRTTGEKVDDAIDKTKDKIDEAKDKTKDKIDEAKDKIDESKEKAKDKTKDGLDKIKKNLTN